VSVAVRLALVVVLLAGQTPVCKIAAARALARSPAVPAPEAPAPACKKGCCAPPRTPAPAAPTRDHTPPAGPHCPTDCLSPLCSPAPVLSEPPAAVVRDADVSAHSPVAPAPVPADHHPSRLDRPPRA
jgi:hypothetical protein